MEISIKALTKMANVVEPEFVSSEKQEQFTKGNGVKTSPKVTEYF